MEATGTDRIGHVVAAVMRARDTRESTLLPATLQVVINNKEDGHVHKLSEATQKLPRDRRRAHCGWRAGAAGANASFSSTRVWPLPGISKIRLCIKCFPNAELGSTALHDDPIDD